MLKALTSTLVAAATLTACAQTLAQSARAAQTMAVEQQGLGRELAGLIPKNHLTCLPTLPTAQVKAYGSTLVYVAGPGLKYRTDTTGGCEGIARGDILVTTSNQGQTCQGDISRTIDQAGHFPTGSCALGPFVEYRRR